MLAEMSVLWGIDAFYEIELQHYFKILPTAVSVAQFAVIGVPHGIWGCLIQ